MPNTVPASATALPNFKSHFLRLGNDQSNPQLTQSRQNGEPENAKSKQRVQPIFIKPASAVVGEAEHKELSVAVRLLAMDHDALVAMTTATDAEAQQAVRWMALSCDLAASRLSILVDLLAEARHRLATVQEVARG